jgi:O-antigen/teichoic acid export membrane protein
MIKIIPTALNLPQNSTGKWTKLISTFVVGQGALQLLQLISGFFLIRWLSVEEYAQYSLAFAFQSTAQMLVEFGFSGAIIALVGNRTDDKALIGNYIKAGQYYRNRFFICIGVVSLVLFPLLTAKHNWPLSVTVLLLVSILINLYFSGSVSYYTAPLQINRRLNDLYQVQIKHGLVRILLLVVSYTASVLSSGLAALTTCYLTIANGLSFRRKASPYISEPYTSSVESRKEMFTYLRPIMPGIVFAALQGQIMMFIISVFGQTESIAEIGALSKIGQLYMILNMAGGVIVAPYFARQNKTGLLQKYILITGLAVLISSAVVIAGLLLPELFLFLIGNKYQHLQTELVLLLINSGLGFLVGITWNMNASRKWIFNWMPLVSIPGTLTIQILCAWFMDLNTTTNVLLFSIFTSLFILANRILVSVVGFKKLINYV